MYLSFSVCKTKNVQTTIMVLKDVALWQTNQSGLQISFHLLINHKKEVLLHQLHSIITSHTLPCFNF